MIAEPNSELIGLYNLISAWLERAPIEKINWTQKTTEHNESLLNRALQSYLLLSLIFL